MVPNKNDNINGNSKRDKDLNLEILKIIRDINQNRLPPPSPIKSQAGQWGLELVKLSIREAAKGRKNAAISHMILALRYGVPEPTNSQVKKNLMDLIIQKKNDNINGNSKRDKDLNSEILKIILDINQNRLPPPASIKSQAGQWSIELVKLSIREAAKGRKNAAIFHMILALRYGVPEPTNSQVKKSLMDLIDQRMHENIQKK